MSNRIGFIAVSVILALMVLSSTVFVVDQRQYAAVYALGEIKRVVTSPGLNFKLPPPFQNVVFLDRRVLTLESPDSDRYITAEKQNVVVDWYLKWRIEDPREFIRTFGPDDRRANDRLSQIVKSTLTEELTRRTVRDVLSTERDAVMGNVRSRLESASTSFGVQVIDMRIKRVDFVANITQSVYSRMETERKRVANELRATGQAEGEKIRADADRQREVIVAEAYREAQIIKGEGDALAAAAYADAFGKDPQFAQFYRSLEAYRGSFGSKNDLMVLDPSSEFFRAMRGSGALPASPR